MNAIRNFLRIFYDLSVYRSIVNQSIKQTILNVVLFYVCIGVVAGVLSLLIVLPQVRSYVVTISDKITQTIPQDAVFSIQNGTLQTLNIQTPITIIVPIITHLDITSSVLIDPHAEVAELASSSATVAFGKDGIRIAPIDNETPYIEKYPSDISPSDLTISGSEIQSDLHSLHQSLLNHQVEIGLGISIAIAVALFISRTIATCIYAFIFWLGSLLISRTYSYRSFVNLAYYIGLIADSINMVILLIYHQPYLFVGQLAFFIVTLVVYFSLPVNRNVLD